MKKPFSIFLLFIIVLVSIYAFIRGISLYSRSKAQQNSAVQENLPPGFPVIPIYPEAILVSSAAGNPNGENYSLTLTTSELPSVVMNWYINQLPPTGWVLDILPENRDSALIQYAEAKKSPLTLQLSVIRDPESQKTFIDIKFSIYNTQDDDN